MFIPHYVDGFQLDFTKTIPINYDDLAMYIHPRIALIFKGIWSPTNNSLFSIGHIFDTDDSFDCEDFKARLSEFQPFRTARVNRVFEGKRSSIFFDAEEVEIMAHIFNNEKFTAIVTIAIDGVEKEINDVPNNIYKIVKPFIDSYGIVEPISTDDYRRLKSIKKVKITKEAKKVNVRKGVLRLAFGLLVSGVSVTGLIISSKMIKTGYEEIAGEIVDAEIVR